MGFRRKKSSTINVHRSEEVAPLECRHLVKQASSVSSDGEGSLSGDSSVYVYIVEINIFGICGSRLKLKTFLISNE